MKRLILGLVVALGLFGSHAQAMNNPWFAADLGPVQERVLARGHWNYCFDDATTAYPGFKQAAWEVQDAAWQMTGIGAVEVPPGPDCDVVNTMPSDAQFLSICGAGAAACILPWAYPAIPVYYRRALFYDNSLANGWRSAIAHEGGGGNSGHASWENEQYDIVNFRCTFQTWTVMDCGSGVWRLTTWDRDTILAAFLPESAKDARLAGTTLRYGEQLTEAGTTPCTRVAIWTQRPGTGRNWAGFYGPCTSSVTVNMPPATCIYAGAENALWLSWAKGLVLAGCTPTPGDLEWSGDVWIDGYGNTFDPDENLWRSADRCYRLINGEWVQ